MQEVGQPEKEREASGHARNEELGLVHEQVEVGNPDEAEMPPTAAPAMA